MSFARENSQSYEGKRDIREESPRRPLKVAVSRRLRFLAMLYSFANNLGAAWFQLV